MRKIKNIAIIDDNPIIVFCIKKMLKATIGDVPIESYENGEFAFDALLLKISENKPIPDIIFLDINMPIMDGWQFLEEFILMPIKEKIRINIVTSSIAPLDYEKFEIYKEKTHHLITFNNKPLDKNKIAEITKLAS